MQKYFNTYRKFSVDKIYRKWSIHQIYSNLIIFLYSIFIFQYNFIVFLIISISFIFYNFMLFLGRIFHKKKNRKYIAKLS